MHRARKKIRASFSYGPHEKTLGPFTHECRFWVQHTKGRNIALNVRKLPFQYRNSATNTISINREISNPPSECSISGVSTADTSVLRICTHVWMDLCIPHASRLLPKGLKKAGSDRPKKFANFGVRHFSQGKKNATCKNAIFIQKRKKSLFRGVFFFFAKDVGNFRLGILRDHEINCKVLL